MLVHDYAHTNHTHAHTWLNTSIFTWDPDTGAAVCGRPLLCMEGRREGERAGIAELPAGLAAIIATSCIDVKVLVRYGSDMKLTKKAPEKCINTKQSIILAACWTGCHHRPASFWNNQLWYVFDMKMTQKFIHEINIKQSIMLPAWLVAIIVRSCTMVKACIVLKYLR